MNAASIARKLGRVPGHLRRRRLRLYGVGNAKTGTTSLARMFGVYRVAHEIEYSRLRSLAIPVLNGEFGPDADVVRAELRRRSRRFHLEVDVAALLSPFAGALAELYEDAIFVLTVRDCFSWLDSRIDWRVLRPFDPADPEDSALYAAQFKRFADPYEPEEAVLRDAGVRPIASLLRRWAETSENVLAEVPPERLLVVRTEDLDGSAAVLARFAGVAESTVRPAHENRNTTRSGLLAKVPVDFVVEKAQQHCASLMERFWGDDWCRLASRIARERSPS